VAVKGVALAQDRTIVEGFSRGFVRDTARHALPAGAAYDVVDYMYDQAGLTYKRGGYLPHSAAMGANGRTIGIIQPPGRVVCVDANHTLYDVTSESAPQAISIGSVGFLTNENPAYWHGKLIFTDSNAQFSGLGLPPKRAMFVDPNVTLGVLGGFGGTQVGSVVTAYRSCVHVGYLVLGRNYQFPGRIWFSPLPDIEATWDVASYLDTTWAISGLASTQGVLLVFSDKATERVLGDTPPATNRTNDNMVLQPVANIGCTDARSIVHTDSGVVFGNPSGLWMTNSAGIQSLTEKADNSGISSYWRSLFSNLTDSGIACGLLGRDYLKVDLFSSNYQTVDSFVCYLPSFSWTRVSNMCGVSFATGNSVANVPVDELYVAQGDKTETVRLSSLIYPSATNKYDADGSPVLPRIRTRSFEGTPWLKAWGHGALNLNLADAYADDPFFNVSAYKGFGEGVEKILTTNPIRDTEGYLRHDLHVNCDAHTIALDFQQTNPSAATELISLDLDVRDYPAGANRLE